MYIAAMQPYFLPYIGYFQLINAVDKFVILDDVSYINKGWINRNSLLINGRAVSFTVPLQKSSQNKLIKDLQIFEEDKWRSRLSRTIELAYKRAPFFEIVFALVSSILREDIHLISPFIYNSLQKIKTYIGITTEIIPTSAKYIKKDEESYEDRIIQICLEETASHYINPIGGTNLYDKEAFARHDIKLSFLKPVFVPYKQNSSVFVPGLSIIDLLMHNSPEQILQLLNQYSLE